MASFPAPGALSCASTRCTVAPARMRSAPSRKFDVEKPAFTGPRSAAITSTACVGASLIPVSSSVAWSITKRDASSMATSKSPPTRSHHTGSGSTIDEDADTT